MNKKLHKSFENLFCLSGILAGVFYFLHVALGAKYYPGYSHMSMAVSDLTAVGSPSYMVASRFSMLYGALACLSCTMVVLLVRRSANKTFRVAASVFAIMNWISFIGYTLFPLSGKGFQGTVQDVFHFYVVTIAVVLTAIASLILFIIGGLKSRYSKWLGICAAVALAMMLAGSVGSAAAPKEYFGLFERFSAYSAVVFTVLLSVYGFFYRADEV